MKNVYIFYSSILINIIYIHIFYCKKISGLNIIQQFNIITNRLRIFMQT